MNFRKIVKCAFAAHFSLIAFCFGEGVEQRVSIPEVQIVGGRLPVFSVFISDQYAGDVAGDAVLSNGRFFGIRWIARPVGENRFWIREGEPRTLIVGQSGVVKLVPKASDGP